MNDWNQLEKQLRYWEPRRPSAKLKARLFGAVTCGGKEIPTPSVRHWLAPALAACFLALMVVNGSSSRWTYWGGFQTSNLLATVALDQPESASHYARPLAYDHNNLPKATFEWTNGSQTLTSAAPLLTTNNSKQ